MHIAVLQSGWPCFAPHFQQTHASLPTHDMPQNYWHCPHSMRSRVYETVERPSVCPTDRRQQQQWPAGFLLNTLWAGDIVWQERVPAPPGSCRRTQQQLHHRTTLGSKCGQCHVDNWGTMLKLNTDLFNDLLFRTTWVSQYQKGKPF